MDDAIITGTVRGGSWIETFAGVFLSPDRTFNAIKSANIERLEGLGGGLLLIVLAFAVDGLRMAAADDLSSAWLTIPAWVSLGLFCWLCIAGLIVVLATTFGAPSARVRASAVCLAWSFAPWLIMAPIFLYKNLLGNAFPLLMLVPFLWIFSLQIEALRCCFELKAWQTMAFVFLAPMLFFSVQFMQMLGALYLSVGSLG